VHLSVSSNHFRPCAHLNGLVHTIHLATLDGIPGAKNILSTYACDAGTANRTWSMGESLSKMAYFWIYRLYIRHRISII